MQINPEVINQLNECTWFSNCGKPLVTNQYLNISFLENKKMIEECIQSIIWENVCLEEIGNITAFLSLNRRNEYRETWNVMTKTIRSEIIPILMPIIENKIEIADLPLSISDDVMFNILNIIMAYSCREIIRNEFFDELLYIYLSGHLPCGWEGDYPNGRLIVY